VKASVKLRCNKTQDFPVLAQICGPLDLKVILLK
jgi:hypothetical protein